MDNQSENCVECEAPATGGLCDTCHARHDAEEEQAHWEWLWKEEKGDQD